MRAVPVVAFAPHVRTDLLRKARDAARGPVLVRSVSWRGNCRAVLRGLIAGAA